MKNLIKVVVVLFVFFLSTPTIVSLCEEKIDTSIFYSVSEEEIVNKELKSEFVINSEYQQYNFYQSKPLQIHSKLLLKHDAVSSKIFIPPPDFI